MKIDALIVLANEMDALGTLNEESVARADLASQIATDFQVPYIITCGWDYRSDSTVKIAHAFKQHLIKNGIEEKRILTETNSRDTVGDAVFSRVNLIGDLKATNICVVTSCYHAARAKKIFEFVYGPEFSIETKCASVEFNQEICKRELASLSAFEETFRGITTGDLPKILGAMKNNHPFYNGEVYEKI